MGKDGIATKPKGCWIALLVIAIVLIVFTAFVVLIILFNRVVSSSSSTTTSISKPSKELTPEQKAIASKFQITGRYNTFGRSGDDELALLMPKNSSKEDLKSLILTLRQVRQDNNFIKFGIPPTTPEGHFDESAPMFRNFHKLYGNYALIVIYVFTDPEWATSDNLRKFDSPTDSEFEDKLYHRNFIPEFSQHVKAFYWWQAYPYECEIGTLGFKSNISEFNADKDQGANYEALFNYREKGK